MKPHGQQCPVTLTSVAHVAAALECEALVPPPAPLSLGTGTVAALRNSMARFSSGEDHTKRRLAVESTVGRIDDSVVASIASRRTAAMLAAGTFDARQLAGRVPIETIAEALGVDLAAVDDVVEDTEAIVAAIGRGQPGDAATDDAAQRLLNRFSDHPDGPVAAISLLYQVLDATAALFTATVVETWTGRSRPAALRGTVRFSVARARIGDYVINRSQNVELRFTSREVEFGRGLHRCPGEKLAWTIVDAMIETVGSEGYELDLDRNDRDTPDRLLTELPLRRQDRPRESGSPAAPSRRRTS